MRQTQTIRARRGVILDIEGLAVHALVRARDRADHHPPVVLLHGCGSLAEEIERPFVSTGFATIALDRPGYGFSDLLAAGDRGPGGQSVWLERVLVSLKLGHVIIVAHSLAAGPALLLGQRRQDLVSGLLLIAPFCRPTPHRAMPMLRIATAPLLGPLVCQHVIRRFSCRIGQHCLRACFQPNAVPEDLHLPFHHAASPTAIRMMADELLAFNDDMQHFRGLPVATRLCVLQGRADATADPDWHIDWLQARAAQAQVHLLPKTGHMPHHVHATRTRLLLEHLVQQVASVRGPDFEMERTMS